jgi:hypothetical protein
MYHPRRIIISYVYWELRERVRRDSDSLVRLGNLNNRLLMSYYYYEYNKVMNEYVFSPFLARSLRGAKEMNKKWRKKMKSVS